MFICGGYDDRLEQVLRKVQQIDGNDVNNVKDVNPMNQCRKRFEAVSLKGEVYVFGGYNSGCFKNVVEKYSPSTNKWNKVTNTFDDRYLFCACAYMETIYIFGGYFRHNCVTTDSCLQFCTKDKSLMKIARMKEPKCYSACAVFQGNIVVSGGVDINSNGLNTVESYDVFADKWSSMPCMTNSRFSHSLVTLNNKLFVIGYGFEVFDNINKRFVDLKSSYSFNGVIKAMSIGNKIVLFQSRSSLVLFYDVIKDEWSEESCEVTKDLENFACAKLPWY